MNNKEHAILGIYENKDSPRNDKQDILFLCQSRCGITKLFKEYREDGMCISFPSDIRDHDRGWHCFCSIDCLKKKIIAWRKDPRNSNKNLEEDAYEHNMFDVLRNRGNKHDNEWLEKYICMMNLFLIK